MASLWSPRWEATGTCLHLMTAAPKELMDLSGPRSGCPHPSSGDFSAVSEESGLGLPVLDEQDCGAGTSSPLQPANSPSPDRALAMGRWQGGGDLLL